MLHLVLTPGTFKLTEEPAASRWSARLPRSRREAPHSLARPPTSPRTLATTLDASSAFLERPPPLSVTGAAPAPAPALPPLVPAASNLPVLPLFPPGSVRKPWLPPQQRSSVLLHSLELRSRCLPADASSRKGSLSRYSPPTFSIALQNCEGMRPVTSARWGADEPDHHHITNSCVPLEA